MNDISYNVLKPTPTPPGVSLVDKLKIRFFQSVNARAGTFVQWAVGAGIGWATAKLLELGVSVPDDLKMDVQNALMGAGIFAVSTTIQYLQTKATQTVQKHLGVEQDGWIGPQTVKRAEILNDQ